MPGSRQRRKGNELFCLAERQVCPRSVLRRHPDNRQSVIRRDRELTFDEVAEDGNGVRCRVDNNRCLSEVSPG
jgi:hypothetical protein